jgi:hypothetical protein
LGGDVQIRMRSTRHTEWQDATGGGN